MWVSGQWFGGEIVTRIRKWVEREPELTRRELSRRVCTWLDWRAPNDQLCDLACRKALSELARRGIIELPKVACDPKKIFRRRTRKKSGTSGVEVPSLSCRLRDLGEVEIVLVSSRYSKTSRMWNELMDTHHELGSGPLCGAQLRYLIQSETHGLLGGLSFSAAPARLKDRDVWIGWSEAARRANLPKVVCNSRFLIPKFVNVPNLASHVLGLCSRRLSEDWQERYGYVPLLLQTFVDGDQFRGTCYRAANWKKIGETAGRADGFANGKVSSGPKDIYVFPLDPDWRDQLCEAPEDWLSLRTLAVDPEDWIEEEFARARIYDPRLRERLQDLARDFFSKPGTPIPQVCSGSEAKSKAAYRFFANPKVNLQALLRGHVEATASRIQEHSVVLSVQDTTTLNYTAHTATEGLGPIGTTGCSAVGLIVHDTMAFSVEGTPLGLLDVQCWSRDPEEAGQSKRRRGQPIEAKESYKWLQSYQATAEVQGLCAETMLVSVGDRESDIYELFRLAEETDGGPKLLIRADRGRQRRVASTSAEEMEALYEKMQAEPVSCVKTLSIPRQGSRQARTAKIEVRHAKVTLSPPKSKGETLPATSLWAVYACEVDAGADVRSPVEWMLLTTVPVRGRRDALERVSWYGVRWGIEVYHRVLKSGCRIEDRRLGSADRIESCLAIDLVVAWRVFWLNQQEREAPNLPCDVFFEKEEWQAIWLLMRDEPLPKKAPSLHEMVRMVAMRGGFIPRRSRPHPGTITLWRGLLELQLIVVGFKMAMAYNSRDGP